MCVARNIGWKIGWTRGGDDDHAKLIEKVTQSDSRIEKAEYEDEKILGTEAIAVGGMDTLPGTETVEEIPNTKAEGTQLRSKKEDAQPETQLRIEETQPVTVPLPKPKMTQPITEETQQKAPSEIEDVEKAQLGTWEALLGTEDGSVKTQRDTEAQPGFEKTQTGTEAQSELGKTQIRTEEVQPGGEETQPETEMAQPRIDEALLGTEEKPPEIIVPRSEEKLAEAEKTIDTGALPKFGKTLPGTLWGSEYTQPRTDMAQPGIEEMSQGKLVGFEKTQCGTDDTETDAQPGFEETQPGILAAGRDTTQPETDITQPGIELGNGEKPPEIELAGTEKSQRETGETETEAQSEFEKTKLVPSETQPRTIRAHLGLEEAQPSLAETEESQCKIKETETETQSEIENIKPVPVEAQPGSEGAQQMAWSGIEEAQFKTEDRPPQTEPSLAVTECETDETETEVQSEFENIRPRTEDKPPEIEPSLAVTEILRCEVEETEIEAQQKTQPRTAEVQSGSEVRQQMAQSGNEEAQLGTEEKPPEIEPDEHAKTDTAPI